MHVRRVEFRSENQSQGDIIFRHLCRLTAPSIAASSMSNIHMLYIIAEGVLNIRSNALLLYNIVVYITLL